MQMSWFAGSWPAIAAVIVSTLALYVLIIIFARFCGVRSFSQMSTFDVAVTIALGSMIATTATSTSTPLAQGLAAIATLYLAQLLVSQLRTRLGLFKTATDNRAILLMGQGGVMQLANMRVARVTEDDVRAHLRAANVRDLSTIHAVVMEGTGTINVIHGTEVNDADMRWLLQNVRDYTGGQ